MLRNSCFLDYPDPKTCKSVKNRKSKIYTIAKVSHTYHDGELKNLPENKNSMHWRSPNVILTNLQFSRCSLLKMISLSD